MNKRIAVIVALTMTIAVLAAAPAQACACAPLGQIQNTSLSMTATPQSVIVGDPVTFTITKTNPLPNDLDWSVRDHLPASMEFVSSTSSQGTCTPVEGSVVQCDLGIIPSGGSATMNITATPTAPGVATNYAADTAENVASATIAVE